MKILILAVTLACSLLLSEGHVRLLFPPSRLPHYDFLDNVRTQGPCGTPIIGSTPVTTLMAGSQFQLSFHLAYAHRGGLSIRILYGNGSIAHVVLPEDGNSTYLVGEEDGTTQRVNVTLPSGFECEQCTLQLIRNAGEWSTAIGEPYLFWSCAEVKITTSPSTSCPGDCNNGTCDSQTGTCQCLRGYYGPYCHLRNECEDSSDCSNNGMCVDIQSTNVPTQQCFCFPGYHGPRCQFTSTLNRTHIDQFDESDYTIKREFHSALTMYSRIIEDELEVAVVLNGTGWVAIGVRDPSANGNCYRSAPGFLPFNASNVYDHRIVVAPLPEGGAEEGGAEEGGAEEGGAEEGGAEEGGTTEGGAEEGGAEEGGAEEGGAEEGGTGEGAGGNLHAMDCTDIVIIAARSMTHRIRDYYTRDRSMPQEDDMYGGSYSLTSAVAIEREGKTTAIFRRPLNSTDGFPDHDITNAAMHVIWAIGQTPGNVEHSPPSSIETNEASNTDFYQPDEVKYHGSANRGATQINFFTPDPVSSDLCRGRYRHPDCTPGRECPYEADWVVSGSSVRFRVSSNVAASNWVAIGFSNDQNMANSDIIAGAANGDQSFISDRYATARSEPGIDANEDVSDTMVTRENGRTIMDFTRPLVSTDSDDISLNQCVFFLYAARGGAVNDFNTRSIAYHDRTPIASSTQVCLPQPGQCTGPLEFTGIGSSSAFLKPSLALLASAMLALVAAVFL